MTWIIYALLSAMFAGLVAIFGKIGLKNVDSTLATTVSVLVMAIFLVLTSLSLQKFSLIKTISGNALYFIIFSGVAGALSWLFYLYALKTGPVNGVVAVDRLSIVFVMIFALMFLGESITLKSVFGILFLVVGALLLVFK